MVTICPDTLQLVDASDVVQFDFNDPTGAANPYGVPTSLLSDLNLAAPARDLVFFEPDSSPGGMLIKRRDPLVASSWHMAFGKASSADALRACAGELIRRLDLGSIIRWIPQSAAEPRYMDYVAALPAALMRGQAESQNTVIRQMLGLDFPVVVYRQPWLRGPLLDSDTNKLLNATLLSDKLAASSPDFWAFDSVANVVNNGYDVVNEGYRFDLNSTAARSLRQTGIMAAAPGEVWTLSFYGLVGTANGQLRARIEFLDAGGSTLATHDSALSSPLAFTRIAKTSGAAPALTTQVRATIFAQNAGAGTTIYRVRNAQLERAAAASRFITGTEQVSALNPAVSTPTFVATAAGVANGNNYDVTKPSGIEAGDLLIVFVSIHSATTTATAPSGWTQLRNDLFENIRQYCFYKIASDGDARTLVFAGSAAGLRGAHLVAYRGVDPTTPFADNNVRTSTADAISGGGNPVSPSMAGALGLTAFLIEKAASTTVTHAATWGEIYDAYVTDVIMEAQDSDNPLVAGSNNTGSFIDDDSLTWTAYIAQSFALAPIVQTGSLRANALAVWLHGDLPVALRVGATPMMAGASVRELQVAGRGNGGVIGDRKLADLLNRRILLEAQSASLSGATGVDFRQDAEASGGGNNVIRNRFADGVDEDFDRADNTTVLGWGSVLTGTWGVILGRGYTSVSTANSLVEGGGSDDAGDDHLFMASVKLLGGSTAGGLAFLIVDANNYLLLDGAADLYKVVAGVKTLLLAVADGGSDHYLSITCDGVTIKIRHEATDATGAPLGTNVHHDTYTMTSDEIATFVGVGASIVGLWSNSNTTQRFENLRTESATARKRARWELTTFLEPLRGDFEVFARVRATSDARLGLQLRWGFGIASATPSTNAEEVFLDTVAADGASQYVLVPLGHIHPTRDTAFPLNRLILELWSRKIEGVGNLMWDALLFVPADGERSRIETISAALINEEIRTDPEHLLVRHLDTADNMLEFADVDGPVPALADPGLNLLWIAAQDTPVAGYDEFKSVLARAPSIRHTYYPRWWE